MGSQKVRHNWAPFTFSGGLWYCCSLPCPSFSGSLLPSHFRLLMPFYYWWPISSVQSLSHVQLFATPWTAAHQASVSITNSWSLLKLMSIESVMSSNHLILCCPLLLLPSIFPSIRVFFSESILRIRWPKYWSFNFSLPMNIQDKFPLGLTGFISLQSKRFSRVFSYITIQKHQFFGTQFSL